MIARWILSVLACLFAVSIDSCSSDDGIEGTGHSDGSASGFGSVFVNGVEFDTSGAEILVDGEPATEDALQVGMVLSVSGRFDANGRRGDAGRVEFDHRIAGPVDAVAAEEKRITALGQTVHVDDDTVFVGAGLDALGTEDAVVVSGFLTASDETLATRVERLPEPYMTGSAVDVEGIARDVTLSTCRIGNLTVD
ncbi:MAG: DUF5666 domain-containing protein, partial [Candidatus Binatia bacterium]